MVWVPSFEFTLIDREPHYRALMDAIRGSSKLWCDVPQNELFFSCSIELEEGQPHCSLGVQVH